jgi:hypothetical protein
MGITATVIQTSWSMLKRKDMRRHRRYALDAGVLQVSWIDSAGKMKMTRSRALNISEGGMALELPEAALPLSMVRFESSRFHIRGSGGVRHCHRVGAKFVVGIEFADGLRWRAPEGEVTEPISICDPGE